MNQVRKCPAREGPVKTATRSFSPAKRIDCAAVELQKVPRKPLVKGGFEDMLSWKLSVCLDVLYVSVCHCQT